MQILTVLSAIGRVETTVGRLYQWFSEVFSSDEEASGLFFRMSMQEKSHANLVSFAKKLIQQSPGEFSEVDVNLVDAEDLLAEIEWFRKNVPAPTLTDAVNFAMRIEGHAAENIHRSAIIQSNPAIAEIINGLATADREHFQELENFGMSRGILTKEDLPSAKIS